MDHTPLPPERWAGAPGRYPDPAVRVLDPRFAPIVLHNSAVEAIATGFVWTELHEGRPVNDRVFADMSPGGSDGIRCDRDGNLWAAAGGGGDGFDGVHVFAPCTSTPPVPEPPVTAPGGRGPGPVR